MMRIQDGVSPSGYLHLIENIQKKNFNPNCKNENSNVNDQN